MGAKLTKSPGNLAENEKLTANEDLESGRIHLPEISEKLEKEESQNFVIEIPKSEVEVLPTEEISESSESRISSGSDFSEFSDLSDDVINLHKPFNDLEASDSENPEFSEKNSKKSEFQVSKFLKNCGYNLNDPAIRELLNAENAENFQKITEKFLTPREMFLKQRGPFPLDDWVELIPAPKDEKNKENKQSEMDLKTAASSGSASCTSTFLSECSELDAFGCPVTDSSNSVTSLFDGILKDENGRYQISDFSRFWDKIGNMESCGPFNPYQPTMEDYIKDKDSSGQKVLNCYLFHRGYNIMRQPTHWECMGPDGTRTQDFWTQCHEYQIGLISMFGDFYEESKGPNCARYVPEDKLWDLKCGQILISRVTEPEWALQHCRIQKLAVRCELVPKDKGWYTVWHVRRDLQDDPKKDYSQENEEFFELKEKLLENMPAKNWLQHGPMEWSPLFNPMKNGMNRTTFENTLRSMREKGIFSQKQSVPEFERRVIEVD
ncbi:unnamed protein product [Caenorhabditis nigoni]